MFSLWSRWRNRNFTYWISGCTKLGETASTWEDGVRIQNDLDKLEIGCEKLSSDSSGIRSKFYTYIEIINCNVDQLKTKAVRVIKIPEIMLSLKQKNLGCFLWKKETRHTRELLLQVRKKKGTKKQMFKLLQQRTKLYTESNKSGNNCLLPELMICPTFKYGLQNYAIWYK